MRGLECRADGGEWRCVVCRGRVARSGRVVRERKTRSFWSRGCRTRLCVDGLAAYETSLHSRTTTGPLQRLLLQQARGGHAARFSVYHDELLLVAFAGGVGGQLWCLSGEGGGCRWCCSIGAWTGVDRRGCGRVPGEPVSQEGKGATEDAQVDWVG